MMAARIGINGFGRIGRDTLRVIRKYHRDKLEVVAINSPADVQVLARLLKHDSDYGLFEGTVEPAEGALIIDGKRVRVTAYRDPKDIPWGEVGAEIIVEAAGVFRDRNKAAAHLDAGAKKVLITAPVKAKNEDITVVYGVNHTLYDPKKHHVISNASCTTNCVAPLAKVLLEAFGIKKGFISTIHAYTTDQRLLDNSHRDARRGRSAAINIIPTTTEAGTATAKVVPALEGKISGIAYRVPVSVVSLTDFSVQLERNVTVKEVNQVLKEAAEGAMKGVIAYCEEPLVSSDFKGHPASCIVDSLSTAVADGDLVKVLAWYDNEWGYACRVADVALYIYNQGL